jgi:hypothetical protein
MLQFFLVFRYLSFFLDITTGLRNNKKTIFGLNDRIQLPPTLLVSILFVVKYNRRKRERENERKREKIVRFHQRIQHSSTFTFEVKTSQVAKRQLNVLVFVRSFKMV